MTDSYAVTVEQAVVDLIMQVGEEIGVTAGDGKDELQQKLAAANKRIHRFIKLEGVEEFIALIEDDTITTMVYIFTDTVEKAVKHITLDREWIQSWQHNAQNDKSSEGRLH